MMTYQKNLSEHTRKTLLILLLLASLILIMTIAHPVSLNENISLAPSSGSGEYILYESINATSLYINSSTLVVRMNESYDAWTMKTGEVRLDDENLSFPSTDEVENLSIRSEIFRIPMGIQLMNASGSYSNMTVYVNDTGYNDFTVVLDWLENSGFDRCNFQASNANLTVLNTTSSPNRCYVEVDGNTTGVYSVVIQEDPAVADSNLPGVAGGFAITVVTVLYTHERRLG